MIFYFTGTGNSLYAAKQLDETRVSIPQAMRTGVMEYTADVIGIVSPVYGHEVPPMVRDFLHRAVFHTDYFYMVLTYGNRHGGAAHEGLGISAGVLFALHCALNGSWYKSLFRGKYSALRTVQTVVNLLLILAVLACMVSGLLVSQHIFAVGRGRSLEFGRHLHLVATAWAFVLMTVHLGLHWSIFTALGRKLAVSDRAKRSLRLVSCLLTAALCLYGLYQFIDRRFWEELFHLIDDQKEYDYSQPLIVYWAGTAALSVPFIAAAHYGKRLMAPRSSPAPQNARRHRNRRRLKAAVCDRRIPH